MNGTRALTYLFSTLIDLYVVTVILRLLLQWVRADFYNPLSQFLVKVTNPLLIPMRRVIPSIGRLDTASVVLAFLLELLGLLIVSAINSLQIAWPQLALLAVTKMLLAVLWLYFFLILVVVILSWVGSRFRHPIVPLIFQLTGPVLRPFRKFIPPIGGIDLSPLFAMIAIRFLILLLGY
ncbi:MAG: YggT family protein [Xanthomonadales bacterium]|nr:YggT family protein [Gammaproteobacteria bacterium]NNE06666.1 YggT family protein [Xanthomonadales bacterium]NNL95515.1 YggT family protein [Xanthomonadales bacterium]